MTIRSAVRLGGLSSATLGRAGLVTVVTIQAVSSLYFCYDIFGSLLGVPTVPIPWSILEILEVFAVLGLTVGGAVTVYALRLANRQRKAVETRLAQISGAFQDLLMERFAGWGLTTAERDVAWFVVKGFSTHEIAGLRKTSEGTVKAQTAAIYRKAGVSSRAQLVSLFIEDLMDDRLGNGGGVAEPRPVAAES